METLLNNPDIDINYCICWANETWTRTWYGLSNQVLMAQESLLDAQLDQVNNAFDAVQGLIDLYLALGGGK